MFVRVLMAEPLDDVAELPNTLMSQQTDVNETYSPSRVAIFGVSNANLN